MYLPGCLLFNKQFFTFLFVALRPYVFLEGILALSMTPMKHVYYIKLNEVDRCLFKSKTKGVIDLTIEGISTFRPMKKSVCMNQGYSILIEI